MLISLGGDISPINGGYCGEGQGHTDHNINKIAMPVQYELRRLFHLMNIQTHRNLTQKALFLGAYFNS